MEKNYSGFADQFRSYKIAQMAEKLNNGKGAQEVVTLIEDEKLLKILKNLREREQKIIFDRIFRELSFEELAMELDMMPKQAEMAYYYVIRKIRKALGKWKDEF